MKLEKLREIETLTEEEIEEFLNKSVFRVGNPKFERLYYVQPFYKNEEFLRIGFIMENNDYSNRMFYVGKQLEYEIEFTFNKRDYKILKFDIVEEDDELTNIVIPTQQWENFLIFKGFLPKPNYQEWWKV